MPHVLTAHALLLHAHALLLHRRAARGEELERLRRLREDAHLQQQTADDHPGAALTALAVHGDHVPAVAVEPVLDETHNGVDLLCGS